ncbi:uncharacterized protein FTOL_03175 [Fusarium torulosum]|uniref:Uncharacterized protein n=1 Tax=Fusarium torulosum TaxID=33205 RepID=A0AAE8M351_9HYPO|nr:uncharacterized protein FTOL_03175 [Fusarium torulosum]
MPGRKSSSGSERKPSGSKPDPKASSPKPDPKSGSQPKGSPDKKGKGPMPKSTQDEPSKENQASRDGEPRTHTQPTASQGNTTQAMPGQSSGGELFLNESIEAGPWNTHNRRSDQNREEVSPEGSIVDYPQFKVSGLEEKGGTDKFEKS